MRKYILPLIILLFSLNCFAADGFTHTFDLAKYSACKDVVDYTQHSITPKPHHSKLKALSSSPFPWRFEVTNGYQEGFVYYALLGYASELSGDIPFAYRCYQNSLACIDEDKAFPYPLPRAEIYLAIGRTCLAVGRYMDAKDWLDTAFLESGDNKQLQAAIDRVLIQRANKIGDYPEIIFLHQHLEQLHSPFSKGGKGDLNSPLERGGRGADGVCLTKPEIANYAQILFWSRKDREGFSKLLEGISKLGIDNNLGVKDPLVDKFLNNIMRADDDGVKWFYDLLGWAIVDARAKAGDENFLAFLCNARTLFCKVYDFLDEEDDLKKVKERIDEVRRQIADGNAPWSVTRNPLSVKSSRKKKELKSKNLKISKFGEMEKTPVIILKDLLMLADWKLKQRDYKNAGTNYYLASLIATGTFANIEYDGTYAENAAIMGLIQTELKIKTKFPISNFKFQVDNSYRVAELTLQLYQKATNDKQRAEYEIEKAMTVLPIAHPILLETLKHQILCLYNNHEYESIDNIIKEYQNRKAEMSIIITKPWIASFINNCDFYEAANALNYTISQSNKPIEKYMSYQLSVTIWSWLPNDVQEDLYSERRTFLISMLLIRQKRFPENLMKKVARELLRGTNDSLNGQKGLCNFSLAKLAIKDKKPDEAIKVLKEAKWQYKNLRKQLKLNEISDKEIIKRFSILDFQIPTNILHQINK